MGLGGDELLSFPINQDDQEDVYLVAADRFVTDAIAGGVTCLNKKNQDITVAFSIPVQRWRAINGLNLADDSMPLLLAADRFLRHAQDSEYPILEGDEAVTKTLTAAIRDWQTSYVYTD